MSRAIQVRVSESVVRTVHVEDGVEMRLQVLPIVSQDRTADLLADELVALGFERDGDTCRRVEDDIEITVDLKAQTVQAHITADAVVEASVDLQQRAGERRVDHVKQELRARAEGELDAGVAAKTEDLRKAVTAKLEKKLGDIRLELDAAVGRATLAALKERAAQLGSIEELSADEAGNVTIKVRL